MSWCCEQNFLVGKKISAAAPNFGYRAVRATCAGPEARPTSRARREFRSFIVFQVAGAFASTAAYDLHDLSIGDHGRLDATTIDYTLH